MCSSTLETTIWLFFLSIHLVSAQETTPAFDMVLSRPPTTSHGAHHTLVSATLFVVFSYWMSLAYLINEIRAIVNSVQCEIVIISGTSLSVGAYDESLRHIKLPLYKIA
jgi:hypothetical protein